MKTTKREPHAPLAVLPELDEFLRPFHVHFSRSEGRQSLQRYLTGLLTEHKNKNCDTIAQVVPGTNQQRLHNLLTGIAFDQDDLNDQRVRTLMQLPTEGDAVLVFDDTGFAKQGKCSVGVKRQYSGTLGKTGNCQVTVNCHYAERTLAWPVATRLYLPKEWAFDPDRREKAHVPEDIKFQTKPEIALALLDHAKELGIRHAAVTADGDYGDNPNFLAGLELRKERYVNAVRCDFSVAMGQFAKAQQADALVAGSGKRQWRTVRWREGSKGWLLAKVLAIRCWRVMSDGRRRIGWLIGEDATDGKRRYYSLQLRSAYAAGADGGVRAPSALGGAVPRGSQGAAGLGPVSGKTLDRLSQKQCAGDAGLQFPGVAGVPATPKGEPARQAAAAFFPLGPIAGDCPCQRSIVASSIGCGVRPFANRSFVISPLGISSLSSVHYSTDKVVLARIFPTRREALAFLTRAELPSEEECEIVRVVKTPGGYAEYDPQS